MAVRVARFEIDKFMNGEEGVTKRWYSLMVECQRIANCIHEQFLVYHVTNGSADKLRDHLNRLAKWREGKIGDKPKCSINAFPKELCKIIYDRLGVKFGNVSARVRTLLQNSIQSDLSSSKAASGSLSGWISILFNNEGLPSFKYPMPVPFDTQNSKLIEPESDDGEYSLILRLDRCETKPGVFRATADEITFRTKSRKMASQRAILKKISDGTYKFCGSSISYSKSKRKWFVHICWDSLVDAPTATGISTAEIEAGVDYPWNFTIDGNLVPLRCSGDLVGQIRHSLLTQRWSRQSNYRQAGSSNKGHGRARAILPIEKLSQRWKDFTKRLNHEVTRQIVNTCLDRGVTRITYKQPKGAGTVNKRLTTAGKVDGREDSTGWDFAQFGTMLAYKCKDAGIHCEILKVESNESEVAEVS